MPALALLLASCRGAAEPAAAPTPVLTASPAPTPAVPAPDPTPDRAPFRVANAMEDTRVLSVEIGIRHAGSNADARAAAYIRDRLAQMGLEVRLDPFPLPQGGESWNVVGTPPGLAFDRPYLLVGGHYDSLNGPGANDNATGVGATIEIARAIRDAPAALPVVFVGFGAEERQPVPQRVHHVGSRHHVERMTGAERENLVALINLDMIGIGDEVILGHLGRGPEEATERVLALARELGIPAQRRQTPDWSDNGPFLRAGLNAAWLWAGDDPCCIHTVRDTFDRVQAEMVERVGRLALATVRSY